MSSDDVTLETGPPLSDRAPVSRPAAEFPSAKKTFPMSHFIEGPKKIKFNGHNTSKFLKAFDLTADALTLSPMDRCLQLALNLPPVEREILRKKKAWKEGEWKRVQEIMLEEFDDEEENKWSPRDMDKCARKARAKRIGSVKQFVRYHRKFRRISDELKKKDIISHQEESNVFLSGLSKNLRARYEDMRSRRRLDLGEIAEEERRKKKSTTDTNDDDEPLFRRKIIADTSSHRIIPALRDIARDITAILRDDEIYDDRYRRRRRHRDSGSSSSEEESSDDDSGSSDSDSDSESSDSDSDSSSSSRTRKGRKGRKGRKELKKGKGKKGKKEKAGASAPSTTTEGTMSDLARQFNESLKIFASSFQQQQQASQQPAIAPFARPQYSTFASVGQVGGYSTANGTPTSRPVAQPFACHTCGSTQHAFKDSHLCDPMKGFIEKGIIFQNPVTGNYRYRNEGPLPLSGTIQEPNFKTWIENQEAARARQVPPHMPNGAEGKTARFQDVNVLEYQHQQHVEQSAGDRFTSNVVNHQPRGPSVRIRDWGTESDLEEDLHFQVEAAKRTRIVESESSQGTAPPVKKPDTRSVDTRRKENQVPAPPSGRAYVVPTPVKMASGTSAAAAPALSEDEVMTEATVRRRATHVNRNQVEERHPKESVVTKLLDSGVTMPLGMLLASSPDLAKALIKMCQKHRVPLPDNGEPIVFNGNFAQLPDFNLPNGAMLEAHLAETSPTNYSNPLGLLSVSIGKLEVDGLVDSGSMICLVSDALRHQLGLTVVQRGGDTVRGIGGHSSALRGVCENVPVQIGGSVVKIHFFVAEASNVPVLLGLPFLVAVQAQLNYSLSGSTDLVMKIGSKTLAATLHRKGTSQKKLYDDNDGWNTGDWQGNAMERAPPMLVSN